jgi:hypothetical protein
MSAREELLLRLDAVAKANAHYVNRWRSANHIKDDLAAFCDETLVMLDKAIRDEGVSDTVIRRVMGLLTSGQRKNLESVVRNIVICAETEKHYTTLIDTPINNSWKVFAPVEKYARTVVCGMRNALETPTQAKQIISVFHGVMAVAQNFAATNDLYYFDAYVIQHVLYAMSKEQHFSEVMSVFRDHPEESQRLHDFVVLRGLVDSHLLEAVVFFGDDGLPKPMMTGIL